MSIVGSSSSSPELVTTYLIIGGESKIGYGLVKAISERENTFVITTSHSRTFDTDLYILSSERHNISILELVMTDQVCIARFGQALNSIPNLQIDCFISNSPTAITIYNVLDTPRDVWLNSWESNTLGPIEVMKQVRPFLAPKSKLIFISSIAGSISQLHVFPFSVSAYGSSNLALQYVVKELSVELKDSSIVIAISPGAVKGEMRFLGGEQFSDAPIPWITVEESILAQLQFYDNLTQEDSGKFFSHENGTISIVP